MKVILAIVALVVLVLWSARIPRTFGGWVEAIVMVAIVLGCFGLMWYSAWKLIQYSDKGRQ